MLRMYLMQQLFSFNEPGIKVVLFEMPTMRRYAGFEMLSDRIHDETTILAFRHLLSSTNRESRTLRR